MEYTNKNIFIWYWTILTGRSRIDWFWHSWWLIRSNDNDIRVHNDLVANSREELWNKMWCRRDLLFKKEKCNTQSTLTKKNISNDD